MGKWDNSKLKFNAVRLGGLAAGGGYMLKTDPEAISKKLEEYGDIDKDGDVANLIRASAASRMTGRAHYIDAADAYANQGHYISFYSVPNEREVYFKAYISAYNETFNSDWGAEHVYGRTDPIYLFKNTQRKITLAFKIPCASLSEGYDMLARVQELTHYLYPSYTNTKNATTISQSPLIRLGVMNLVADNENSTTREAVDGMAQNVIRPASAGDPQFGLLGIINNLTINHNLESDDGVMEVADNFILPKLIEINLDFSPIHEKVLGWDEKKAFAAPNWPYGTEEIMSVEDKELLTMEANAKSYNAAVEAQKAADRKREQSQAILDNASARYVDAMGEIDTKKMSKDAKKINKLTDKYDSLGKKDLSNANEKQLLKWNNRMMDLREDIDTLQDMHDIYSTEGGRGNVWG